ncbi:MAG: hypothetical protein WC637_20920 [Victivallales bacterium]
MKLCKYTSEQEIDNCNDCHYCCRHCDGFYCHHNKVQGVSDFPKIDTVICEEIPAWCPLPDAKPPDATPEEEGLVVCPLAGICLDREDYPEHGQPHAKKSECNIVECGAAERIKVGPCIPAEQAEKGGKE